MARLSVLDVPHRGDIHHCKFSCCMIQPDYSTSQLSESPRSGPCKSLKFSLNDPAYIGNYKSVGFPFSFLSFFGDFVPLTCLYTFEDQNLVVTDYSTDGKINTHVEQHSRTLVLSFSNTAPEGQLPQSGRQELIARGDSVHRPVQQSKGTYVSKTTCRD